MLVAGAPTGAPEGSTDWLEEQLEAIRKREAKKTFEYTPPALSL